MKPKVNKENIWEDVDLTRFCLEPSVNRAVIELTSCFDGSDLARIICSGILLVKMSSTLAVNGSELPVFIGKVTINVYSIEEHSRLLEECGFGFKFGDQMNLRENISEVTLISIHGGEIEALLIAKDCEITKS